jgi:phosphatidate cytidylyltransferase
MLIFRMKRVLTGLILIPLVLALVFFTTRWQWIFTAATAGVAALAAWELLSMAEKSGARAPRVAVLLAILLLFAGDYQWPDQAMAIFGILSLALLVYCAFTSSIESVMPDALTSVFCLLYCGQTLVTLPALKEQANGPSLVCFLLFVVWAGDIAALYVGRSLGRHKLAPRISPNKTWEGSIGSILGSLLATGGLLALARHLETWNTAVLSFPEDVWFWMGLAVLINVVAQVGDLVESALKRSVDVKDSGALLPGHGGVLDRVDALLLAAPALWYAQLIHTRI